MNPAALAALLKGDIENAVIAQIPGGIEAQVSAGQAKLVADSTLPIKCNHCTREQLEQMGIVFFEPIDDLFVNVKLPDGWKKVPTNHSMWSDLVDEKERARGGIFYKAAFYDRNAFIRIDRRFSFRNKQLGNDYDTSPRAAVVTDQGEVIWQSESESPSDEVPIYEAGERYLPEAEAWLEEHYPDWRDPLAYWD